MTDYGKINTPHGRVLLAIGAYKEFHALSKRLRSKLYRDKVEPSNYICADDSLDGDATAVKLICLVHLLFHTAVFKDYWMEQEMYLKDYVMVARHLAEAIIGIPLEKQKDVDRMNLEILRDRAEKLLSHDILEVAFGEFLINTELACHSHSRMDGNAYWVVCKGRSYIALMEILLQELPEPAQPLILRRVD